MVALSGVVQAIDRLGTVADVGFSALKAPLPSLEEAGRQVLQRALSRAANAVHHITPTSMAVGSDAGVDVVVARLDPTASLNSKTFTIDGPQGHPWVQEDLANLTHAATERERVARERGRGAHQAFINPVPRADGIVPWASPEPPKMREGAKMESRHPLMKW